MKSRKTADLNTKEIISLMKKNIPIHILTFVLLHIFGALTLINSTFISITTDNGPSNFSIKDNLLNLSSLYIFQYLIITLAFCILFTYIQYCFSTFISRMLKNIKSEIIHTAWATASTLSLLSINCHLFPETIFSLPPPFFLESSSVNFYIHLIVIFIPTATLAFRFTKNNLKTSAILIIISLLYITPPLPDTFTDSKKPNIILIGIDSLRPELMHKYMPFLQAQLSKSMVYTNAYTPFARTYPAWTSIVTGRHPINHNARFNLQPESTLNTNNSYLPNILKAQGYQTIYASDERRFSNLGKPQGFEKTIGPRTGASDFILGNYSDFPISNLLTVLPLARWTIPELYANRAAHHLYRPKQFIKLLISQLDDIENKPLFLATHFCLAHWPYSFIGHKDEKTYVEKPSYPDNLRHIDKQIENLFSYLNAKQLLDNSKIVFLSDHGESWGKTSTHLKDSSGRELFVSDYGHGMNILSPDSHKVLIGLKGFTVGNGNSSRLTSLMDIKPTILDEMNIDYSHLALDGSSLLQPQPKLKEISFESGLIAAGANTANPDSKKIAQAEAHRYRILKDGTLRLKHNNLDKMIQSKQLALRINDIAIYRGRFSQAEPTFILANFSTSRYSTFKNLKDMVATLKASPEHKILVNRFCQLYSENHPDILNQCVTL